MSCTVRGLLPEVPLMVRASTPRTGYASGRNRERGHSVNHHAATGRGPGADIPAQPAARYRCRVMRHRERPKLSEPWLFQRNPLAHV